MKAYRVEVVLAELSRELLRPLAGRLTASRLVVIAEGSLALLPFDVLFDPDPARAPGPAPLLLERHEVTMLPLASALVMLHEVRRRRPRPDRLVAVVGDPVLRRADKRLPRPAEGVASAEIDELPDLPSARAEMEAIRTLVEPGLRIELSGVDAHRDRLLGGALRGFRIVHFATHAVVDPTDPEASRIVLSRFGREGHPTDGSLYLRDVGKLQLDADLVVLAACRTALGPEAGGEAMASFAHGFLRAGVPSVLVTLWSVDDEATFQLMKRFYTLLLEEGLPPAAALREAKLSLRQDPQWRRPYFWAGFSLQGHWRWEPPPKHRSRLRVFRFDRTLLWLGRAMRRLATHGVEPRVFSWR